MKVFILTILILALCGAGGAKQYDPVHIVGSEDSANIKELLWIVGTDTVIYRTAKKLFPDSLLWIPPPYPSDSLAGEGFLLTPTKKGFADTCIRNDPRMYVNPIYRSVDTIRICCCTVFVDKPCTVYVESRWVDSLVRIVDDVLEEIKRRQAWEKILIVDSM